MARWRSSPGVRADLDGRSLVISRSQECKLQCAIETRTQSPKLGRPCTRFRSLHMSSWLTYETVKLLRHFLTRWMLASEGSTFLSTSPVEVSLPRLWTPVPRVGMP